MSDQYLLLKQTSLISIVSTSLLLLFFSPLSFAQESNLKQKQFDAMLAKAEQCESKKIPLNERARSLLEACQNYCERLPQTAGFSMIKGQATREQVAAYYQQAPQLCDKAYIDFMAAAKVIETAEEEAGKNSVSITYGLKDSRARKMIDDTHQTCLAHKNFSEPVCQCATKAVVDITNTSGLPGRMPRDYWVYANRCNE